MIRLTKVEIRRLTARRLTVIGVIGVLAITALLLLATWFDARPLSEEEQRSSQAQFESAHQYWVEHADEDRVRCQEDWQEQPDPKPTLEEMCSYPEPTIDQFGKPRWCSPRRCRSCCSDRRTCWFSRRS
jgi:ABC-2 type transport system permease protein